MRGRSSNRYVVLLVLLSAFFLISGRGRTARENTTVESAGDMVALGINGRLLRVEVARTPAARRKGLMYRESLGENEGMLFVFEDDRVLTFWMKNTGIPLSIAFLEKNGKVTDIFDMEPYSKEPVRSSRPCRYAIEANRDFFSHAGLQIGDRVNLDNVTVR
jgi:uncharacterized membrane protein (UPF0127 family)